AEGATDMRRQATSGLANVLLLVMVLVMMAAASAGAQSADPTADPAAGAAQAQPDAKTSFEIYGFAMLDIGQNFKQINPNWFDTMRVTRLPSSKDQFGRDNSTFAGVRQSRLGVKSSTPTALGDLKTTFEVEL